MTTWNNDASPWFTEDHGHLQTAVRKFYDTHLVPNILKWRNDGLVDSAFWKLAGDAGFLGASIPENYGGSGGPASFDALIMLEQSRCGDTSWGFGIGPIVAHYVLNVGSEEQKHRWLPGLASGQLIPAIAMTEPGTGSDLKSIRTKAVRDGNTYRIDGSKIFITNGQTANLICVVARTSGGEAADGISLFMVEADAVDGVVRGKNLDKLGLKGQDTSELFFENLVVDEGCLLGEVEGQGFHQLMRQLPWERLLVAISALGLAEYALGETIAYVGQRKAFGRPLTGFQNTRFELADMKARLEVGRAFVDRCLVRMDGGALDATEASIAKLVLTETVCDITDRCLQLHGGYGYMNEYPIARLFADARVQRIYGGTNEIMKELIARSLI